MNTNNELEHPDIAALLQSLPAPTRLDERRRGNVLECGTGLPTRPNKPRHFNWFQIAAAVLVVAGIFGGLLFTVFESRIERAGTTNMRHFLAGRSTVYALCAANTEREAASMHLVSADELRGLGLDLQSGYSDKIDAVGGGSLWALTANEAKPDIIYEADWTVDYDGGLEVNYYADNADKSSQIPLSFSS
ncbi:MAG: hypothetical protein FWG05_05775, partial [Kiritimatiellaeota bacterium]|nr:hypothetical protein [Kiritimatiellota bacterium]